MIGVGGEAIAADLTVNLRTALAGRLQLLKYDDSGPFGHNESVPPLFKGAAGRARVVVSGGEGLHDIESGNPQGSDSRFGASGNHGIGVAPLNHPEGVADGMSPRGTGRHGGDVGPLGAVADRYLPRSQVDDQHGDEEGGNLSVSPFEHGGVIPFDSRKPTETGSHQYPHAFGIFFGNLETGVLHGQFRRPHGKLDEEIHFLDFFFIDEVFGVEIPHFTGDLRGKFRSIKPRDAINPRLPLHQAGPVLLVPGTE